MVTAGNIDDMKLLLYSDPVCYSEDACSLMIGV